jgi:hypothetical protein
MFLIFHLKSHNVESRIHINLSSLEYVKPCGRSMFHDGSVGDFFYLKFTYLSVERRYQEVSVQRPTLE